MRANDMRNLEGEPVPPGLRDKLMADAMTASADARSRMSPPTPATERAREVRDVRKTIAVAGFAAVLIAVGLWLLPRGNSNYALADVARAMANVKSVHYVGWERFPGEDKTRRIEGWAKGDDKARSVVEDHVDQAVVDGRRTEVCYMPDGPRASVWRCTDPHGWATPVDAFFGENISKLCEQAHGEVKTVGHGVLNGRSVTIIQISFAAVPDVGKARFVITTDDQTDLIAKARICGPDGKVSYAIETIEYNTSFPDSVFDVPIPEGVRLRDCTNLPEPKPTLAPVEDPR